MFGPQPYGLRDGRSTRRFICYRICEPQINCSMFKVKGSMFGPQPYGLREETLNFYLFLQHCPCVSVTKRGWTTPLSTFYLHCRFILLHFSFFERREVSGERKTVFSFNQEKKFSFLLSIFTFYSCMPGFPREIHYRAGFFRLCTAEFLRRHCRPEHKPHRIL